MQKVDLNNAGERKKLVWAIGLGLIALIVLWWTFFGFGSSKPPANRVGAAPSPTPANRVANNPEPLQDPETLKQDVLNQVREVVFQQHVAPAVEARRNIFAFYEPPVKATLAPAPPTPTPTPTPPVLLVGVSPANVYARTSDFTLEVTGDKFTGQLRINIDGRDLPTKFISPQQMSAVVPAAIIANPGQRQVTLRSPDSRLYSNVAMLNIAQPPTPNYTYIGILGTKRFIDTAYVQDRNNRDVLSVQRGDVLGGRFRVTSISEKELVLVDTNLKIRHSLALSQETDRNFNPMQRPTPKVDSEDDEPN